MVNRISSSSACTHTSFTDRTAQEVAKLTYRDMLELLTMKSQWKRDLEKMMAERDLKESQVNQVSKTNNTNTYNVPEICT
ncbi:hypothetical protein G6F22_011816 [Rhizopus arrhizus]|nr:hypothetical protein G6F23_011539 [Rhizopus arrhizus]KAG0777519.1 hypothetical protein G6F22_011816 [Rhizopus arrhizus]